MGDKNNQDQGKEKGDEKQNINLDPTNPQSPYYLCSSDSPSNVISPIILTGNNYVNWSRLTINALRSKNKLGFVDGGISKPQNLSPEVHAWERCNSMVIAWLYNIIDKTIHGSVAYAETARQIWIDLEERYSQGNAIRIHQLKRELTLTTQGKHSVAEYFTKLKVLWDELENYQLVRSCTCGAGKDMSKRLEEEKIHQFLMGLDSDIYGTVRSNILSLEPLPTLNKIYAFVIREERQLDMAKGMEGRDMGEGVGFKATASVNRNGWGNNLPRNTGRTKCSHCHKLGHEREQCFELVGYPPNWGNRRNTRITQGKGRGNLKLWGNESGGQDEGHSGPMNKARVGEAFLATGKPREEGEGHASQGPHLEETDWSG